MLAKLLKGNSTEEIKSALIQQMADARLPDGQGFQHTLAFVFISIKQDYDAIAALLGNNEFHNHTCCWEALKEK